MGSEARAGWLEAEERREGEFEGKPRWDVPLRLGAWSGHSETLKGTTCMRLGQESRATRLGTAVKGFRSAPAYVDSRLLTPAQAQPWANVP